MMPFKPVYIAYAGGATLAGYLVVRGIVARGEGRNPVVQPVLDTANVARVAVNAPITAARGGVVERWIARNGARPTHLLDMGSPTYWPQVNGSPHAAATRDMKPFVEFAVTRCGVPNPACAACYAVLAAWEATPNASRAFHFNGYGLRWFRTMEPRPCFLSNRTGTPLAFQAFESWEASIRALDELMARRYSQARARAIQGDLPGFTGNLGEYNPPYGRNPRTHVALARTMLSRGDLRQGQIVTL